MVLSYFVHFSALNLVLFHNARFFKNKCAYCLFFLRRHFFQFLYLLWLSAYADRNTLYSGSFAAAAVVAVAAVFFFVCHYLFPLTPIVKRIVFHALNEFSSLFFRMVIIYTLFCLLSIQNTKKYKKSSSFFSAAILL